METQLLPWSLRRNTDPKSSHQSAVKTARSLATKQEWTAQQVAEHPGLTKRELSNRLGLDSTAMRRMNECWHLGMVSRGSKRKCESGTGREAFTWHPPGVAEAFDKGAGP